MKSFGLPSEGMVLLDKRPDIQLTVSFEISFFFLSSSNKTMIFFLLPDNNGKFCSYSVLNFYRNLLHFYESDFTAFCSKLSTQLSVLPK